MSTHQDQNITSISLREFQRNASKYLSTLPVLLTQYGKAIAKVSTFSNGESKPVLPIQKDTIETKEEVIPVFNRFQNTSLKVKKIINKAGYCPHFIMGTGYCGSCGS